MTNRKDKCIARHKHPSASVPARQVIALAFEWTHLSMASVNPDSWNNKSAEQQVCQVVHRLRPWWFACRGVLYYLERASMTTTDAFCLFVPHGLSFVCPWQLRKHEGFPLFSQVQSLTIARHLLSDKLFGNGRTESVKSSHFPLRLDFVVMSIYIQLLISRKSVFCIPCCNIVFV